MRMHRPYRRALAYGNGFRQKKMKRRERLTAEEVLTKLKDDGDFDSLRLKVIRKVKDNEDLRNNIIAEVKQSVILKDEGSENLKLRQLSDAVYQELGSKIMGQISDEVWKVIRTITMDDIKETVETVFNRILNPKEKDNVRSSPCKEQHVSHKEDSIPPVTVNGCETIKEGMSEPAEPPGFGRCKQQSSTSSSRPDYLELVSEQSLCLTSKEQPQLPDPEPQLPDALPPGFGPAGRGAELQGDVSDDDPDLPPGFGS